MFDTTSVGLCYVYSNGSPTSTIRNQKNERRDSMVLRKRNGINSAGSSGTCDPMDRSNSTCTRNLQTLTQVQVQMHRLDEKKVRETERVINSFVDGINNVGIVSESALMNRESDAPFRYLSQAKMETTCKGLQEYFELMPYFTPAIE